MRYGPARDFLWAAAAVLPVAYLSACHHHHNGSTSLSGLNRAPSARLAVSGDRKVSSPIHFDGRSSSDPDGDHLAAEWSIFKKPSGSALEPSSLGHPAAAVATLVPDMPGMYKVRLTISDGELFATAAAAVQVASGSDGNGGRVALICPSRGYVAGGDLVTITGGYFPPDTTVRFGQTEGVDAKGLEDGSLITVRTPPASAPGIVDITIELGGDEAVLVPNAFTYLPGPLAVAPGDARDVSLARSPTAMAELGGGRVLLGDAKGAVQLFTQKSDGSVSASNPLQVVQIGRVERLRAGKPHADGTVDVGGTISDGSEIFVVHVASGGALSFVSLPFDGQAVDLAVVDFDSIGADELVVADRSKKRVVVYTATSTGDGAGGESFAQTAQFPTGGAACVLVPAQLDADPSLEIVVGSLPGPPITLIDPTPRGIRVSDHEVAGGIDGIILLEPADFYGRGRDSLAAITFEGDASKPAEGSRSLRVISLGDADVGVDPPFEADAGVRFSVAGGETGMSAKDLDGDGDVDLALFDGGSGDIRILINTSIDGSESTEGCAKIAETGSAESVFGFREFRVHAFPRTGLRALAATDLDGDGFPDLATSHARDLQGVRVLPNFTGK